MIIYPNRHGGYCPASRFEMSILDSAMFPYPFGIFDRLLQPFRSLLALEVKSAFLSSLYSIVLNLNIPTQICHRQLCYQSESNRNWNWNCKQVGSNYRDRRPCLSSTMSSSLLPSVHWCRHYRRWIYSLSLVRTAHVRPS